MQLYSAPASPFARKVRAVLIETGLIGRVTVVQVSGNAVDPGTMPVALNPLGKIPALVTDGGVLYDSRVICRYLDDLAGGVVYPKAPALWDHLVVEALADGIMDAAVLMTYEARVRPEPIRFAPWVEGQWAKIDRALAELESRWLPLLNGDFGMAQIAVASALDYVDFRHAGRNWQAGRPALSAWLARAGGRASLAETRPA